jgi:hypothetical protein
MNTKNIMLDLINRLKISQIKLGGQEVKYLVREGLTSARRLTSANLHVIIVQSKQSSSL